MMDLNLDLGWHHELNGHKLEQALGDGDGQGSLAWCSPWSHKESNGTVEMNNKIFSVDKIIWIQPTPLVKIDTKILKSISYLTAHQKERSKIAMKK